METGESFGQPPELSSTSEAEKGRHQRIHHGVFCGQFRLAFLRSSGTCLKVRCSQLAQGSLAWQPNLRAGHIDAGRLGRLSDGRCAVVMAPADRPIRAVNRGRAAAGPYMHVDRAHEADKWTQMLQEEEAKKVRFS